LNGVLHFLLGGDVDFVSNGKNVCALIDCGVNWEPDISVWFNKFGLLFFTLIVIFLGGIFKYLVTAYVYSSDKFSLMALAYFIFLQLISFPCGQFITTSSSNILSLLFLLSYLTLKKIV
jgi:hypothetical protein